MYTTQTCGVTVAQVILVHFVEVRILTGLPFFCLNFCHNLLILNAKLPLSRFAVFSAPHSQKPVNRPNIHR